MMKNALHKIESHQIKRNSLIKLSKKKEWDEKTIINSKPQDLQANEATWSSSLKQAT